MTLHSVTDPAASMRLLADLLREDVGQEYVTAAKRRREEGTHEQRRWVLGLLVTCVCVAMILALGVVQRDATEPAAIKARAALIVRAQQAQARVDQLEAQLTATRSTVSDLQSAIVADSAAGAEVSGRLKVLEMDAGYTAVVGPGLIVTIDDAAQMVASDPGDPGRVQDRDVQLVVNGLWQSGAEAVAINGRRLTATTAIRTAGMAILVDYKPILPPYQIEAIGNPALLASNFAATSSGRALDQLVESFGLSVDTTTSLLLHLPAAVGVAPISATVPSDSVRATLSAAASASASAGSSASAASSASSAFGSVLSTGGVL